MPRNKREYMLRYADECKNDLERALAKIEKLKSEYEPTHPKYAQAVESIGLLIAQAHDFITTFRNNVM